MFHEAITSTLISASLTLPATNGPANVAADAGPGRQVCQQPPDLESLAIKRQPKDYGCPCVLLMVKRTFVPHRAELSYRQEVHKGGKLVICDILRFHRPL